MVSGPSTLRVRSNMSQAFDAATVRRPCDHIGRPLSNRDSLTKRQRTVGIAVVGWVGKKGSKIMSIDHAIEVEANLVA